MIKYLLEWLIIKKIWLIFFFNINNLKIQRRWSFMFLQWQPFTTINISDQFYSQTTYELLYFTSAQFIWTCCLWRQWPSYTGLVRSSLHTSSEQLPLRWMTMLVNFLLGQNKAKVNRKVWVNRCVCVCVWSPPLVYRTGNRMTFPVGNRSYS